MITLNISFDYEGKKHKLKACLKNSMTLSDNKQNQATDLIEDFGNERRWSLYFADFDDEHDVEIIMYRDADGNKTLEADYAIIWSNGDNGVIEDEVDAQCMAKYL